MKPALAEDRKFSFLATDDFSYQKNRLAGDTDQYFNSTSVFLKYRNWTGGLTLRENNYYKQTPNFTLQDSEVTLFRKYIQYTTPKLELQAGDFQSMLGRGLVLSVLQNDRALRDRTVLGGDAHYHSDKLQVRALGGDVEDELKQQKWRVAAAEISRDYWKGSRFGFHGSYIHDAHTYENLEDRLTWSFSWNADKLPAGFSYYTEIARLNFRDSGRDGGSAYYSNLGWTRKNLTLLFEFKKYSNFDNRLNNPPSADRGDQGVELADSETVRLYSQYSFFNPDIIVSLSMGRASEYGLAGLQIYTGIAASELGGKVDFSIGYSFKDTLYPITIIDGSATYRLTSAVAASISARDKRYHIGSYKFDEQDWTPQISWASYGSVFFQRQYSEAVIDGHHDFNSYGLRINVRRDSYIEFSTGRVRGGEVCSSGQCFYSPPFRGWKLGFFATVR
jgi:hypothetical protein